jgi:hypothetical protein
MNAELDDAFWNELLGRLLQGFIPDPILRLITKYDSFLDHFDTDSTPVRVVLALRDDYVYALNRWKRLLPALGQNNFELGALRGPAAFDAVFKPGELRCHYRGEVREENKAETGLPPIVDEETAERIIRFVAKKGEHTPIEEIEAVPPILSLLCRELNERRFTEPAGSPETPAEQITFSESDTDVETIIKSFYERCVTGRPEAVRVFIEEELVSYSGARLAQDEQSILSCFEKGWKIPGAADGRRAAGYGDSTKARTCLDDFVKQRLLTSLGGGDNPGYELIHDLLAAVVEKSRLTREAVAQARRQRVVRRKRWLTAAAYVLLVILPLMTLGGYYFFIQEHRAYYREFNKRNGFPVGITQISESEARRLPVSFRLIHKGIEGGIVFDGWKFWKLRWKPVHRKPAFRVEAVNGLLELTTNHGVFPYLWKGESESQGAQNYKLGERGERLGLKTVCQWEFVSTTNSEIIYERALDRAGRMVYGLIYSPSGSASPSTRYARYVGRDGFPQFQRGSVAEYVQIHYDRAGWEDRVMYHDGKGLPAAGPDGAFGKGMQHNESTGQVTCVLSLDADEHAIIDNDGNSGMQSKYDEKGYDIEDTSVGPGLKPMPVDGYVICKNQYDRFGRLRRISFHGVNGEPVRSKKDGYHGWQADYDEQGNQTGVTYLGLDGKPMPIADGYAIFKSTYDSRRNLILQTFHGVNKEPVLSKKDGYHGFKAEYDEQGNRTVETYLGLDGKPMPTADGYATLKATYDARGKLTRMRFYGVHDEPVLSKRDGYHGFEAHYDEQGNQIVETYIGLDRKSMLTADGYATVRMGYDLRSKLTLMRFYGVQGEPVLSKGDGYHGSQAQYDEQGNKTVVTYIGLDGKPMPIADGYATVRMAYDARGNVVRQTFHGANGEAVLSKKDGYHGRSTEYDERGNTAGVTYLGLDGKPMPIADGYATMKSTYDSRGDVIRQTFHGVDEEPILSKKGGYHGWKLEYDDKGNNTVMTYIGLDGKPMPIADGYATMKSTYDARGNVVRQTFHSVNEEPVLSKKNDCHGWEAEYDEEGNQTVETYLGLDGKPTPIGDGWATVRWAYDARGNVIRQTFYGANGEPVLSKKDGHYGWEAEYDENGNKTIKAYLGKDGKPLVVPAH